MEIPPPDIEHKQSPEGVGPLAAIVIIVALMAAAGVYFLVTQEMARRTAPVETQVNS